MQYYYALSPQKQVDLLHAEEKMSKFAESYLCERSKFAGVENELSTCRDLLPYSVPQGSVLGPVLMSL